MALLGYESDDDKLEVRKRVVHCIVCHSDYKHLHQRLLSAIHQSLSLRDEKSVNVSAVISVHTLGRHGQIKIM